MTDREFTILCWRLMIEFVRGFGRHNGLCIDIQIIKPSKLPPESAGLELVNE